MLLMGQIKNKETPKLLSNGKIAHDKIQHLFMIKIQELEL